MKENSWHRVSQKTRTKKGEEGCYKGALSRISSWKKNVHYRSGKITHWQGFYNCFFTVDGLSVAAFDDYLKYVVQLAFNEEKKKSNDESVWYPVNESFFECFKPQIDAMLQDTGYRCFGSYVTHHIHPEKPMDPYLNIDFHFFNINNPSNTDAAKPYEKLTLNIHVLRKTAERYGDETVLIGKISPKNEIKMDGQEIVVCVKEKLKNYLDMLVSGHVKQNLDSIRNASKDNKKADVSKETTIFSGPVVVRTLTIA